MGMIRLVATRAAYRDGDGLWHGPRRVVRKFQTPDDVASWIRDDLKFTDLYTTSIVVERVPREGLWNELVRAEQGSTSIGQGTDR